MIEYMESGISSKIPSKKEIEELFCRKMEEEASKVIAQVVAKMKFWDGAVSVSCEKLNLYSKTFLQDIFRKKGYSVQFRDIEGDYREPPYTVITLS
jgi:hypothetical protein